MSFQKELFKISSIFNFFRNKKDSVDLVALALITSTVIKATDKMTIEVGNIQVRGSIKKLIQLGSKHIVVLLTLSIADETIKQLDIHNKVWVVYKTNDGKCVKKRITYKKSFFREKKNLHGPIKVIKETKTSAYFRQSSNNLFYFTVRKENVTDSKLEQIKLMFAYYCSRLFPIKKRILMFEKEGAKYEESASVLFEKLVDFGYTNVSYILKSDYKFIDRIPSKYKKYIVNKNSFKHYLYFFKSQTFIGTERLGHAIDLRIANRFAQDKLADKTLDYVFLQHGVMYMISLDSEARVYLRPKKKSGKYRVVVSSQKEADHFIELGQYNSEMLYIAGLPKFDKSVCDANADKIVIMPTWRPWEYVDARFDVKETKYYQMIHRIYEAIPTQYQENVIILPHPLFFDCLKDSDSDLSNHFDISSKYDDILKKTRVLITDYSSIAYDAFYRGTNVIFYWEEKEECMKKYGPTTKLMISEGDAFGDVCYNQEQLSEKFVKNYKNKQSEKYVNRYKQIVEFDDGKNTERLISLLKKDGII